jgi:hypothetical protein
MNRYLSTILVQRTAFGLLFLSSFILHPSSLLSAVLNFSNSPTATVNAISNSTGVTVSFTIAGAADGTTKVANSNGLATNLTLRGTVELETTAGLNFGEGYARRISQTLDLPISFPGPIETKSIFSTNWLYNDGPGTNTGTLWAPLIAAQDGNLTLGATTGDTITFLGAPIMATAPTVTNEASGPKALATLTQTSNTVSQVITNTEFPIISAAILAVDNITNVNRIDATNLTASGTVTASNVVASGGITATNPGTSIIASNLNSQSIRLADAATNNSASLLYITHTGHGDPESYGINLYNHASARSAMVIHNYSSNGIGLQIDSVANQSMIKLKNATNNSFAPGGWGTSPFLEFGGYTAVGGGGSEATLGVLNEALWFVSYTNTKPFTFSANGYNTPSLVISATGVGEGLKVNHSSTGPAISARAGGTGDIFRGLDTAYAYKFTIKSNGWTGINTSAPAAAFHVGDGGSMAVDAGATFGNKVFITNGHIAINTNVPKAARLWINQEDAGATIDPAIEMTLDGWFTWGKIYLGSSWDFTFENPYSGSEPSGGFVWRTESANRMWLSTDGELGIGTNTPASQLHVGNGGSAIVDGWLKVGGLQTNTGVVTMLATNFILGCTDGVGSWKVGITPAGNIVVATNTP